MRAPTRGCLFPSVAPIRCRESARSPHERDCPVLRADLLALLERLAPRGAAYEHDDFSRRRDLEEEERPNGHSHAKALLLHASETVHMVGGWPRLGRYQRLFLVELDGPREREISLMALGMR